MVKTWLILTVSFLEWVKSISPHQPMILWYENHQKYVNFCFSQSSSKHVSMLDLLYTNKLLLIIAIAVHFIILMIILFRVLRSANPYKFSYSEWGQNCSHPALSLKSETHKRFCCSLYLWWCHIYRIWGKRFGSK